MQNQNFDTFSVHSIDNTFVDVESGIVFYEWAVGSSPGHADILPFTKTEEQEIRNTRDITKLQEGHSYYITVKVTIKQTQPI